MNDAPPRKQAGRKPQAPVQSTEAEMFKYETWFMWTMLIAPIVLGLVLALVVPSYLERTRVTRVSKCEQAGGTWDREAYACVKPPESN